MKNVKAVLRYLERELAVYAYSVVSTLSLEAGGAVTWAAGKAALYSGIAPAASLAHKILGEIAKDDVAA